MIPAVLIAGTHSGVGKTTVALGLMAALKKRGYIVQPFKVGPDFIDPSHHGAICGRPSRNLDPFMMGLGGIKRSFFSALEGADMAIVEGVMGLYDGLDAGEEGSTAQVAKTLGIPVLLVLNVHGMSRSAAAVELGYVEFDKKIRIAGTILNNVGSERHLTMLKNSLKLPIYGALPRNKEIEMESRHLGLVMGFEREYNLDTMASMMEDYCEIDKILKLNCITHPAKITKTIMKNIVKIGVAKDEAFCFYYYENLHELQGRGAEIIFFSPLRDDLPNVDGLYIGGGYPELHADGLEKGRARHQIRKASQNGLPIYGECGGLMYLCQKIFSGDNSYRMAGVLPADIIMTKNLQALGYVEAEVKRVNPMAELGRTIRGHEFHYSRLECERDAKFVYKLCRGRGIGNGWDGLIENDTLGGYLHTHFYSHSVDRFIESCKGYRKRRG